MPKYKVEVQQHFTRRAVVEIEIHERQGVETEMEVFDIIDGMEEKEFEWEPLRASEVEVQRWDVVE